MKKALIALGISLLINLSMLGVNYWYYTENGHLFSGVTRHGGEITIETGFGWILRHIYTMHIDGHDTHTLQFSILLFLAYLAMIFLVVYLLILVIGAFKRRA